MKYKHVVHVNRNLKYQIKFYNKKIQKKKKKILYEKKITKEFCESIVYNDGSISCSLCGRDGNLYHSGRLLNFYYNKWVHFNCAIWTHGVIKKNFELVNFYDIYTQKINK